MNAEVFIINQFNYMMYASMKIFLTAISIVPYNLQIISLVPYNVQIIFIQSL